MKRRNLLKTKRAMAVIISASMIMGMGMQAMAESEYASDVGVEVNVSEGGTETKTVENATASIDDKGDARGVNAYADENSSATVEVEKDASATAEKDNSDSPYEGGSYAYGVSANSTNESSVKVSVGNDVTSTAGKDNGDKYAYNEADGIYLGAHSESTSEVTVGNNISVSANGYEGDKDSYKWTQAGGIFIDSTQGSIGKVTVGNDVSVAATGGNLDSNGMTKSEGVKVMASEDSKGEVSIGNDLTVSGIHEATGIMVDPFGNSVGTVNVGGNVSVTSKGEATGVNAMAHEKSKAEVDIGKDLTVSGGTSYGISTHTSDAKAALSVDVGGDVKVSGEEFANSISGSSKGTLDIKVGGNVIQEGKNGVAVQLNDFSKETGKITVKVAENITAADGAVSISKATDKSTIDLVVGGTISGGEHAIVLEETSIQVEGSEDWTAVASSTENLNITVWKVEPVKDTGNIVETSKYVSSEDSSKSSYEFTRNEEAEKSINYIIKVDPVSTTGGALGVSGTTELYGYQTAHEGDNVYLEVTVPAGYVVSNFYNVDGAASVDVISKDDKYYLVVPRGGGVFVGVNLRQVYDYSDSDSDSSDDSSSGSNNQNWTVGNGENGIYSTTATVLAMQITAPTIAGTNVIANVADVLKPVDKLTAINNFFAAGLGSMDTNNIMGTGIVSLNNLFATASSNTIDVPVAAGVMAGQTYTVYFSDGTNITVPCAINGVLNIPFNKNAEGLTYIIYGMQLDPSMFLGMPAGGWTY